jgi:hypothetical protein
MQPTPKGNIIQSIEKIHYFADISRFGTVCFQRPKPKYPEGNFINITGTQERNFRKDSQGSSNKASYLKNGAEF